MNFLERIRKKIKERQWGKNDWLILILVGVLLMVVVWPTGSDETDSESAATGSSGSTSDASSGTSADAPNELSKDFSSGENDTGDNAGSDDRQLAYAAYLEKKLEDLLSSMDGVGKVRVMITLEDDGETVLEKDTGKSSDSSSESTVIFEQDDDEYPYITSYIYPGVLGVVVVAEGAGTGSVSTDITELVVALFGLETHKVKVVKMETAAGQ